MRDGLAPKHRADHLVPLQWRQLPSSPPLLRVAREPGCDGQQGPARQLLPLPLPLPNVPMRSSRGGADMAGRWGKVAEVCVDGPSGNAAVCLCGDARQRGVPFLGGCSDARRHLVAAHGGAWRRHRVPRLGCLYGCGMGQGRAARERHDEGSCKMIAARRGVVARQAARLERPGGVVRQHGGVGLVIEWSWRRRGLGEVGGLGSTHGRCLMKWQRKEQ